MRARNRPSGVSEKRNRKSKRLDKVMETRMTIPNTVGAMLYVTFSSEPIDDEERRLTRRLHVWLRFPSFAT